MAYPALPLANTGNCSSAVCRRWLVRCSSAGRRGPLIFRTMKGASFVCCAYAGDRVVTENAKEVMAVSKREEGKKGWVHFVGIGGCGLSALAMLALKQGFEVSGSDIIWSYRMNNLQKAGVKAYLGHSIASMENKFVGKWPDAIVVSSCIPNDNEEILHAKSVGIPIYKRDSWLRIITHQFNLIAIAGTHGKSTTTAMLSYVLHAMGDDLIAVVGANVPQLSEGNIIPGNGPNFVLEADEYDCCFLGLSPTIAVVTNVEWEHVDMFDNEEHVRSIFRKFVRQIKTGGNLILCGDGAGAYSLLGDCKQKTILSQDTSPLVSDAGFAVTTYGMSSRMDWHASSITLNSEGGQDYILHHKECPIAEVNLKLPGDHNVLNSLAVIATISNLLKDRDLNETINSVKYHLSKFEGISRRFEFIGKVNGCCVYDDYAHHPSEVRATLRTARQMFPFQPLWIVFQAHSFSRIAAFMKDFSTSFDDADYVIVTEIVSPREKYEENSYGKDLANLIRAPASVYIPKMVDVLEKLVFDILAQRNQETIVFAIGTDDEITALGPKLLRRLQEIN